MDIFFEADHLFDEVVNGDLFIFNDTTDNELADSVGNWFLSVFFFPGETFHFDGGDLLEEGVKIGFFFPWLHVEENDGLGNWAGLLLAFSSLLLLSFKSSLSFLI